MMHHLSVAEMKILLRYEEDTGDFYWLSNRGGKALAGSKAGTINSAGYVQIFVGCKMILGHNLAWAFVHGDFPELEMDHRNGIGSDNRIENLRLATSSQQKMNQGIRKDNSSGVKGVGWIASRSQWSARVQAGGRYVLRKRFDRLEDAKAAVEKARKEFHGEFANHGNN